VYLTSDDVRDILQLLDSLPYGELHLRTGSFSLSLRRDGSGEWTQAVQALSPPKISAPPAAAADAAAAAAHAGLPAAASPRATDPRATDPRALDSETLAEVRTPLPGTFYRAPKPGAPPFVEVGSRVGPETVVGIIETMKLMNSVIAEVRGTVAEICLRDAEFAGQDAVLMRIEPETGPEGA
jgi:acetyl-CoA carboxylase biotin carboxyl carrier protein